jgi:fatty-acyl-CoA synthase
VLKEGCLVTGEEIIGYCRKDLAGYKTPKRVDFLKALPKTGSGKIYKKGLRELDLK